MLCCLSIKASQFCVIQCFLSCLKRELAKNKILQIYAYMGTVAKHFTNTHSSKLGYMKIAGIFHSNFFTGERMGLQWAGPFFLQGKKLTGWWGGFPAFYTGILLDKQQ